MYYSIISVFKYQLNMSAMYYNKFKAKNWFDSIYSRAYIRTYVYVGVDHKDIMAPHHSMYATYVSNMVPMPATYVMLFRFHLRIFFSVQLHRAFQLIQDLSSEKSYLCGTHDTQQWGNDATKKIVTVNYSLISGPFAVLTPFHLLFPMHSQHCENQVSVICLYCTN